MLVCKCDIVDWEHLGVPVSRLLNIIEVGEWWTNNTDRDLHDRFIITANTPFKISCDFHSIDTVYDSPIR